MASKPALILRGFPVFAERSSFRLISPAGTQSIVAEHHNDDNANYDQWTFTTKRSWDELAAGDWTLKFTVRTTDIDQSTLTMTAKIS